MRWALAASVAAACIGASASAPAAVGDARAAALVVLGGVVWMRVAGARSARGVAWAAIAVRLPWLLAAPVYSDDVYRYVWEGRVWAAGANPFVRAPDDPALAGLRDAVWAHVNHPALTSIYPPLAQAAFVLLAPAGVLGWKLVAAACDVGTAVLLARRRPEAGWLWALLPLTALESAGSGHLEALGVLLLVAALDAAARGRTGPAAAWAWAGAMVKLLPGAALLAVLRTRRAWAWAVAVSLVAAAPVLAAGEGAWRSFLVYRATWSFDGSAYPLLAWALGGLPGDPARLALQGVGAAVVAVSLRRTGDAAEDAARAAMAATGAFVLLSPTVHPWYVLWPLAVGLWRGAARPWALAAVLVPAAYRVLATLHAGVWQEQAATRWLIWAPVWALLAGEALRRRVAPSGR